ncbi:SirA family protein [Candidatus Arthromitus sp. SFB-mouse-Japan]|uniref:sulfurtransferase-like selenium metabolism protein YedF n=1 Tax=unclassified Candidatus Neoarthromitus TaxID=2638829 RepID=UPI00021B7D5A|nr:MULTISPECIES: sulfurtransferase-like selenium metabolism protein YedF [unclassified Candidatus Arthromitus]EIA22323.1 Putative SirA-like protein [Candidatus Arthromitus sp. SFB-1]EIA29293.1 Putative SirA-like protein [Candidatus Arthromitus sp. SFB-4]EIA29460.1 Putative SirA-like protein [Candidatus Arthromitus sp. SFB-co]EIA29505.1 Putative SirA-like protein [Candidatus Arthromitus sp. SFB-5]EIA30324.1 Putative SirA-like protein [Candidatus Arthromitus sp. SFB-mouse-SU]
MIELDLRKKSCPIPLVETRKFINNNKNVDFKIILDNEVSFINIKKFLENNKINYSSNKSGNDFLFEVIFDGNEQLSKNDFQINNFTILVMSELFGNGSDELSNVLMKSYFYALDESITLPSNIIFINSGVKLLTNENIIKNIDSLREKGVSIYYCGICVDYYSIKDKVRLDEITNMYSIIDILNNSDNVIRI